MQCLLSFYEIGQRWVSKSLPVGISSSFCVIGYISENCTYFLIVL